MSDTSKSITGLRVAIVHDYLNQLGGAERCLDAFHELFPDAPMYTLVYDEKKLPHLKTWDIRPSFLQYFPGMKSHYKYYLPWFPFVVKTFNLRKYDLIISISHAWVKGVSTHGVPHISYCLTPVRYAWDLYEEYLAYEYIPLFFKMMMPFLARLLRRWDRKHAKRVNHFIAISDTVARRIEKYYNRSSTVIYPPVDTTFYKIDPTVKREDFYLTVSRLKAYKRIDIIIEAFNALGLPLVVIGDGSELKSLQARAHSHVQFLTDLNDDEVRNYYRRAKGFIFAGHEDFGLVNAEAQACGLPSIAYDEGGSSEIVQDGVSGVLYPAQTKESLMRAVHAFEGMTFDSERVRAASLRFERECFKEHIRSFINEHVKKT